MPDELETLRFAAGKRVEWLPEAHITKSHFFQNPKRPRERLAFPERVKKFDRFAHRKFQEFVSGATFQFHFEHVRLETSPFAFRAAHVEIAQELHLDFLETGPATTLAAA